MTDLIFKIESELDRLEVGEGWAKRHQQAGTGISVLAEEDLPAGWLSFTDSAGEPAYCAGLEALENLQQVAAGTDSTWEEAWEAIDGEQPRSSRDWPENLISFEQLEDGGPNDQPVTVVTVKTNAGERFAVGPHGVNTCALEDSFNFGGLSDGRQAAIDSYERSACGS